MTPPTGFPPEISALLEQHKLSQYFSLTPEGKVKCEINGHQFPPRLDVATAFINGSKFTKLRRRYDAENILAKYEPFILQSANFENMLYCALTGQLMDKSLDAVKKHMQGKRFQNKKTLFAADKLELKDEPDIDTVLAEITGRSIGKKKKEEGQEEEGSEGMSEDEEEGSGEDESNEGGSEEEAADDGMGVEEQQESAKGKKKGAAAKAPPAPAKGKQNGKQGSEQKGKQQAEEEGEGSIAGTKRKRGKEDKVAKGQGPARVLQQQQQQQQQQQTGSKGKRKGRQQPEQAGGEDVSEEEPELWVPEEFADTERAMGGEPSTSEQYTAGKSKKGKKGKKQRESDDFDFSGGMEDEGAAGASTSGNIKQGTNGKKQSREPAAAAAVTAVADTERVEETRGGKGGKKGSKAGKGAAGNGAAPAVPVATSLQTKSPKQNAQKPSKAKKAKL